MKVATPKARFTADVVFEGDTYAFADPTGDDKGPAGTYTFGHQMDLTGVKLEVGATTMNHPGLTLPLSHCVA